MQAYSCKQPALQMLLDCIEPILGMDDDKDAQNIIGRSRHRNMGY